MATFNARRLARRAPKVFTEADGTVSPLRGQQSKLLQIKPLDVVYRRLVKRIANETRTRSQREQ
jgi:hypothetical protein